MKKIIFLAMLAVLLAAGQVMAASGCTVTSSIVEQYKDQLGEHTVFKLIVTQTGTTFSFTPADFENEVQRWWRGYAYWVGIDPVGTLDAAPQLTVTDEWSFTQFSDTTSFHTANPIKVTGNSYDGQYFPLTGAQTWSFNDVGTSEVLHIYIDAVR